jgi:hypothetical protein
MLVKQNKERRRVKQERLGWIGRGRRKQLEEFKKKLCAYLW